MAINNSVKYASKDERHFYASGFHGNFGYIGLAVAFYYLGNSGFANASIFAGFIMILQNMLAVTVLQAYSDLGKDSIGTASDAINIDSSFPLIVVMLQHVKIKQRYLEQIFMLL